jgi:hypothetical protein
VTLAETAIAPEPVTEPPDAVSGDVAIVEDVQPEVVETQYSKVTAVLAPPVSMVPFSVAVVVATLLAAVVIGTGAVTDAELVVKLRIEPFVVFTELTPIARKEYKVDGDSPVSE